MSLYGAKVIDVVRVNIVDVCQISSTKQTIPAMEQENITLKVLMSVNYILCKVIGDLLTMHYSRTVNYTIAQTHWSSRYPVT